MKTIFLSIPFILIFSCSFAQYTDAPFRLFGEVATVDNQIYRGFISWGGIKNYWIDFFEASKPQNPYSSFFSDSDEVFFNNGTQILSTPPRHIFSCRFGNIKSIRPTDEKEVLLQLKNGYEFTLIKGNSKDIRTNIQVTTPVETVSIKWDHPSEIHFMSADSNAVAPHLNQVAGIVKSSQGIYKGLINWNYNSQKSIEKNNNINNTLQKMKKIVRWKGTQGNHYKGIYALEHNPKAFFPNTSVLEPMENVMINMPNTGLVTVTINRFNELEMIPLSELTLLSYDDFAAPETIKGEVITRNNEKISGSLAYDLDENMNFEVLDGKNNNITYQIPFKYIRSIEPKNYKYSFITLKNGSQLSLGDAPDVNHENSGIIIFGNEIPVYIPWNEIKAVNIE